MEEMLRVGVFANTHGVRGEIKVFPTTDDVTRFKKLKKIYLDKGTEKMELEIASVKYFKNMVILKFKGIDNINDIEKYKGKDLLIERKQAVKLEEDEYFICDIIGASVVTEEGENIGTLTEVLKTGANDVYVVEKEAGGEVLIPVIDDCVLDLDFDEKIVTVRLMAGMMD
ncbi:MAG: ribosome maturation factor RimM [Lachnospiraceae bacterium]|nr:ribosome maturation factor RimM [Lachnospiraceae bacterium]